MATQYTSIQWNRQKRLYDVVLAGGVGLFLLLFAGITRLLHPRVTDEILLLRAFGAAAYLLLHIILCIGPLCRLSPRFLPLLYNRRHAGVTLALLALIHAALVNLTYHAGGNTNPILSIFQSSPLVGSVAGVPFQPFGFVALLILLLMAATSHDFWLANLTAPVWKTLHMLVYVAYGLLVLHVAFGVLQAESHPLMTAVTGTGLATVLGLHLATARRERPGDTPSIHGPPDDADGYVDVCAVAEIPEKRAKIACLSGERIAIFRFDGTIAAVSNVCQHQNGPLGEGRIRDGCITCPWHGYQYLPDTGASPPPFVERVPTFKVRVQAGRVLVHPAPNPPGTPASVPIPLTTMSSLQEASGNDASRACGSHGPTSPPGNRRGTRGEPAHHQ